MDANYSTDRQQTRVRSFYRRKVWQGLAAVGLFAGIATGTLAAAADEAGPDGLRGILSTDVSDRLGSDVFSSLGPNWEKWSTETTDLLDSFLKAEGDLTAQKARLALVKARVATLDAALADSKYAAITDGLSTIRGALGRQVDLAEAIVGTLELNEPSVRVARLSTARDHVTTSLATLKAFLKGVPGGDAWVPFLATEGLEKTWGEKDEAATLAAAKLTAAQLDAATTLNDEKQRAFLSGKPFGDLRTALSEYIAAATPADPSSKDTVRKELKNLLAQLQLNEEAPSTEHAKKAREALDAFRRVAADGGALVVAAVQKDYFNYNMRAVASEAFLSKLMADSRMEQGQVRDFILGANVGGYQWTNTNVTVNLKPSPDRARFDIVLNGTVQSSTVGVTDQATVNTSGHHYFTSTKEVQFDGSQFYTLPATFGARANNTTTGITTQYSGSFLFGGFADRIAAREVASKRPASEAIAAQRIQERVVPRFNSEVDSAMANAGKRLNDELFAGLKSTGLYPDAYTYQTTETDLLVSTRLMPAGKLGGNTPPKAYLRSSQGATVLLHETLLNNTVDNINLAGRTMTDEEVRNEIEGFLSRAFNRKVDFKASPKPATNEDGTPRETSTMVFAKEDPVRFRAANGELVLVLRCGFKQPDRDLPISEITVPLQFAVTKDNIEITRGTVSVGDVEGDLGIATKGVIRKKVQDALPDRQVDRKFLLQGTKNNVYAYVMAIHVIDGWVIIEVQ